MSVDADVVRRHADLIAAQALSRVRARLQALTPAQERALLELVDAIADGMSRLLREECARRPELAAIYRKEH